MSRRLKILLALLGMLCIVALVNFVETYVRPIIPKFAIGGHSYTEVHGEESEGEVTRPQKGEAVPPKSMKPVVRLGLPSAPVKIKAYLLGIEHCHRPTFEVLKSVAGKYRDQVYIEIVNMETPEGQKIASRDKVHCVSIFVNGKKTFQLPGPGGKRRTVVLSGMVGASFTPEDIEAIVREEVSRARGAGSKRGAPTGKTSAKGAGS